MAKVLLWDLESSSLNGDFGAILCFGYKWLGERQAHVLSVADFPRFHQDPSDDRELVRAAYDILESADLWVTWYGKRFDVPLMATRLLDHREALKRHILPPMPHVDGWEIARYRMKLHSNRLASVSTFLDVEEKTPIRPRVWRRALSGHRPSLQYVIDHCEQDCVVLEDVYQIIRPLLTTHPSVAVMDGRAGCPVCGHDQLKKRGTQVALTRRYQRFQCRNCGTWTREAMK